MLTPSNLLQLARQLILLLVCDEVSFSQVPPALHCIHKAEANKSTVGMTQCSYKTTMILHILKKFINLIRNRKKMN